MTAPLLAFSSAPPAAAWGVGTIDVFASASDIGAAQAITTGPDGGLWFGRDGGIGRMSPTGAVTTFRDDRIQLVTAIAAGPDDALWFTDQTGDAIGRITLGGSITRFTSAALRSPTGIAAGPDGNLWFTNRADGYPSGGGSIGRITPAGTITTFTNPAVGDPAGITLGPDGALWFTNGGFCWYGGCPPSAIGRITTDGAITVFTDPAITGPDSIATGSDGNLWVTNAGVCSADPVCTPRSIITMSPAGAILRSASVEGTNITAGPDGNLWFVEPPAGPPHALGRITPDGVVSTVTDPALGSPIGLTAGPDGALWSTDPGRRAISRTTTTGTVTWFPGAAIADAVGITIGPDGSVWFTNGLNHSIGRRTPDGTVANLFDPSIQHPVDLTTGPDGNVWFTDDGSHSIGRIAPGGTVTAFPSGTITKPGAIAIGPDGALWFTSGDTDEIGRVTTAGTVSTLPGGAGALDLAAGPDGALWFTQPAANAIGRMAMDGTVTTFTGTGIDQPQRVTSGPEGNLWFTNAGGAAERIGRITTAGSVITFNTSTSVASDIAAGPDGNLWFTVGAAVGRISPQGSTTVFSPSVNAPPATRRIASDGTGHLWFTTDGDILGRVTAVETGTRFHPVTPFRLIDSRNGTGVPGPVRDDGPSYAQVAGVGGIPPSASAVVMNLTVTHGTAPSYLTVFPTAADTPTAANLLFGAGDTIPNLVTTRLGAGGQVTLVNQHGTVDVVADVVGWYDDGTVAGDGFTAVPPARILDSRTSTGGWAAPLGEGTTRDLAVAGQGGVPVDASAVVMNVTVTDGTAASYVQAFPAGTTPGTTANLLFGPGQTVPNLVVVGIGTTGAGAGKVAFFNQHGDVHLVADVLGYYEPGTGAVFHPMTPARLLDDRDGTGLSGPWGADQSRSLTVTGGAIPAGATAITANVTVTGPTQAGFLTVFPAAATRPGTANVLFGPGQTVPNTVQVGLAPDGALEIYNQQGSVDVILDVSGWFAAT